MFKLPIRPLPMLMLLMPLCAPAAGDGAACRARSGATVPTLVELYTSEGCSSCPPADRWLSALKGRRDTVALAFHVDYWDRLGWQDRFASAAYSQRQAQQQRRNGARFSYTPQVVVDGRGEPRWNVAALPAHGGASTVQVTLARDGAGFAAQVLPAAGAPAHLAGYWALTENGHRSVVGAGENQGATLAHDFVVRDYRPLPAWTAAPGRTVGLRYSPMLPADGSHAREVKLVLVDADSGRPVQAIALGC